MLTVNNNWENLTYLLDGEDFTDKPCMLIVDNVAHPVKWIKNHVSYGDMGHTYNVTRSEMEIMAKVGETIKIPVRITDSNIAQFKETTVAFIE